jgi:hypothetical protein
MKQHFAHRKARALAALLVATALVSTPVFAQDTAPQTAPAQPVIVTPPSTATVPIPPVVRTVPDGAASAPSTTADEPAARPARAATATRTATRTTRTVTHTRTAPAARTAPTPEAAPAPAPKAAAPAPEPVAPLVTPPADTTAAAPPPAAPAAAPANEPAAPAADTASTQSNTTTTEVPFWAWVAGGIALLAVILGAALAMRGRRREYDEPVYIEDSYVEPQPEPVAVAPVIQPVPVAKAEQPRKEPEYLRRAAPVGAAAAAVMEPVVAAPDAVEMSTPPADEVAALTAGTAPIAERPWLEFAIRPVRAGTNVDEALVEIELTVGNSGTVAARGVRISTFLLSSDPNGSEMERLLLSPPSDATTDPVTIKPGEGKRIDATLALLKSDMGENPPDTIRPIIVADARYTLEDGTEGRTSASFTIGVTPEEGGSGLDPLELSRSSMHENVGAELRGEPQHA